LSLGHHAATVLLIPGCIWYVATTAPRKAFAPRSLLATVAAMLAGFSIYLYLPLRYSALPAFNYAGYYDAAGRFVPIDLWTFDGMWWLVSGRAFARQMLAYGGAELWGELGQFGVQLWRAFFGIGIGPALLGLLILLRRDWRLGGMLLLLFGFSAAFYVDYRVIDKDTMFLPAFLIWALWLGVGYETLLGWLRDAGQAAAPRWGAWVLRAAIVGAVLFAAGWNWRLVDQSDDWSTRMRGENILYEAQPDALVLGWWDTVPPIQYLQLVEGQRLDVQAINRFLIAPDDMRRLIVREMARRPIYIDSPPQDLLEVFDVQSVGLLYQLLPRGSAGTHGRWRAATGHCMSERKGQAERTPRCS